MRPGRGNSDDLDRGNSWRSRGRNETGPNDRPGSGAFGSPGRKRPPSGQSPRGGTRSSSTFGESGSGKDGPSESNSSSGIGSTTKKFSFSRSLRTNSGAMALQSERSQWNKWVREARSGQLTADEARELVEGARLSFPSSVITKQDCGHLVYLLVRNTASGEQVANRAAPPVESCGTLVKQEQEKFKKRARGVFLLVTYFSQKKSLEFGPQELGRVLEFLLEQIGAGQRGQVFGKAYALDALNALSFMTFNFGGRMSQSQDKLLCQLLACVELPKALGRETKEPQPGNSDDLACISAAFTCLGNLLQRKALDKQHVGRLARCASHALELHQAQALQSDDDLSSNETGAALARLQRLKVMASALRVMHGAILAFGKGSFTEQVPSLASSLMQIVTHGLAAAVAEQRFKQELDSGNTGSTIDAAESDALSDSDVERRNSSSRFLKQMEKVRLLALELLQSLCRTEFKAMQLQWERILPQRGGTKSDTKLPSILTVVLFDPQPRVRAAGLATLTALIEHSPVRLWLSQPRGSAARAKAAFASLSVKLARMVEQCHEALAYALQKEQNPSAKAQLLLCTGTLFRSTPYYLKENEAMLNPFLGPEQPAAEARRALLCVLLGDVANGSCEQQSAAPPKTYNKIQNEAASKCTEAAVVCVASLLQSEKARLEPVAGFLQNELLPRLFLTVRPGETPESKVGINPILGLRRTLLLLSKIFFWYTAIIESAGLWEERVLPAIDQGFASLDAPCREAAVLVVEQIVSRAVEPSEQNKTCGVTFLAGMDRVVAHDLPRALKDINSDVRAAAASCLAQVRPELWTEVPAATRQECVQCVVDATAVSGSSPEARMATVSALGSMALCPEFKFDESFITQAIPVLVGALEDPEDKIRCRAAIAVANSVSWRSGDDVASDTAVAETVARAPGLSDAEKLKILDEHRLKQEAQQQAGSKARARLAQAYAQVRPRLLNAVIGHCNDTDKVAAPSLRAVGFLLAARNDDVPYDPATLSRAAALLAVSISDKDVGAKTRVNACNAAGDVLDNDQPLLDINSEPALARALQDVASKEENYKVRMAAVLALKRALPRFGAPLSALSLRLFSREIQALGDKKERRAFTTAQSKHADKVVLITSQLLAGLLLGESRTQSIPESERAQIEELNKSFDGADGLGTATS